MGITIFVVSDRNRTAPVALARNEPVAHAIGSLGCAKEVAVAEFGLDDREIESFGEFAVAVVHVRDGHDGAGAVAGQDIICYPDRDFLLSSGVNSVRAGENTSFFFVFLAFDFGFLESGSFVG